MTSTRLPATLGRTARALAVPIAAYIGVTVGLPGLRGGVVRPSYWLHAVWVLATCAMVVVAIGLARALVGRGSRGVGLTDMVRGDRPG